MVSIKLKVELPKGKFATRKWVEEIAKVQRQTSVPRLRRLFQKTVFGWSTKPTFGWAQTRTADSMTLIMYPQGAGADIWEMINEGTKPHVIRPGKRKFLSFRPGYRASTTPGTLQSRRSYRSGKYIAASLINHPGIEARRFTEVIAEEYNNPYMNEMQDAINNVAKS